MRSRGADRDEVHAATSQWGPPRPRSATTASSAGRRRVRPATVHAHAHKLPRARGYLQETLGEAQRIDVAESA